jgi:hypothetical protein
MKSKLYTTRHFTKRGRHLDMAQECQVQFLSSTHWIHEHGLDVVTAALDLQPKHAHVLGTKMHEAEPCSYGVDDTHVSKPTGAAERA